MTHGEWLRGWEGFDCLWKSQEFDCKGEENENINPQGKMWTSLRKKYRKIEDIVDIAQGQSAYLSYLNLCIYYLSSSVGEEKKKHVKPNYFHNLKQIDTILKK